MTTEPPCVLESPDQLSTDWMTTSLQAAGELPHGRVEAFRIRLNPAFNSAVAHVDLVYSDRVEGPDHVILKIARNDAGKGEVAFYNAVRTRNDLPMLVRCYHAAHAERTGTSNLILADLSPTHEAPVKRERVVALDAVPTDRHSDGIVDALGTFHARWWQHDSLKNQAFALIRPWYRNLEFFRRHCERRRREWALFASNAAGEVPAATVGIYEAALAAMPSLWNRFLAPRVSLFSGVTLTHGDCYLGQFLCPRDPASSWTYIVDFGDVSGNFGPYDLVYAFCTFWTRDQRRDGGRELRLLQRYHEALMAGGVDMYSWEQLLSDYRLMLLFMIFDPVWNQTDGSPQEYWWPKMRCLTDAYEDWDCARLLHNTNE